MRSSQFRPWSRLAALAGLRGRNPPRKAEILRGLAGGLLGVAFAGLAARALAGGGSWATPLLVAPIGASAVLVFAIPASPLAQPRAVIGGNMVSALAGVVCAHWLHQPALAAACAVSLAIAAMMMANCLHPPGGAVALGAALSAQALSGQAAAPFGFDYAVVPVGLCSALLVTAGVAYNRAIGRTYPHRVQAPTAPHGTRDAPPSHRFGYSLADLDQALARYGELLDVSREDLDALFREVELQAEQRLHAQIRCEDIMSRDVITVDASQSARSALHYLQQHDLRTAPVIDERRRVVGIVRRAERLAAGHQLVEAVLDPFVHKVRPGAAIEGLLPLLSSGAAHEALVVDENRVLLGVITQTDLLAVLYRAHVVEAVVARQAA